MKSTTRTTRTARTARETMLYDSFGWGIVGAQSVLRKTLDYCTHGGDCRANLK